jgi:hypothetical protein
MKGARRRRCCPLRHCFARPALVMAGFDELRRSAEAAEARMAQWYHSSDGSGGEGEVADSRSNTSRGSLRHLAGRARSLSPGN